MMVHGDYLDQDSELEQADQLGSAREGEKARHRKAGQVDGTERRLTVSIIPIISYTYLIISL